MGMPLIHRRIGRQKIEIALALYIPNIDSFASFEDNRKWMVVVGAVLIF
jgi:hypothetical protein